MARRLFDRFREHDLITFAFAFQSLVALVALVLLALAVVGEIGRTDVWTQDVGRASSTRSSPTSSQA